MTPKLGSSEEYADSSTESPLMEELMICQGQRVGGGAGETSQPVPSS